MQAQSEVILSWDAGKYFNPWEAEIMGKQGKCLAACGESMNKALEGKKNKIPIRFFVG